MAETDEAARDGRAPDAPGDGAVPPSAAQRVWIWLIGGYLVINAAIGLVSLFLLAGGAVPLDAEKARLINSLPPLLFFAAFAHSFLSLAGGVFLVMRRQVAVPFLAGGAVAKVASEAFTAPPANLPLSPALYLAAVAGEVVILAAILAFVVWLWRRRVLAP